MGLVGFGQCKRCLIIRNRCVCVSPYANELEYCIWRILHFQYVFFLFRDDVRRIILNTFYNFTNGYSDRPFFFFF